MTKPFKKIDFAQRLFALCGERGHKTQKQIARFLGVSQPMISDIATGKKLPDMENAIRWAIKLGVCVDWLLTERGPKHPEPQEESSAGKLDLMDIPISKRGLILDLAKALRDKKQ